MKKWDEMGCEHCRNGWLNGNPVKKISESETRWATLYLCEKCDTYWEANLRNATEITKEEAKNHYNI